MYLGFAGRESELEDCVAASMGSRLGEVAVCRSWCPVAASGAAVCSHGLKREHRKRATMQAESWERVWAACFSVVVASAVKQNLGAFPEREVIVPQCSQSASTYPGLPNLRPTARNHKPSAPHRSLRHSPASLPVSATRASYCSPRTIHTLAHNKLESHINHALPPSFPFLSSPLSHNLNTILQLLSFNHTPSCFLSSPRYSTKPHSRQPSSSDMAPKKAPKKAAPKRAPKKTSKASKAPSTTEPELHAGSQDGPAGDKVVLEVAPEDHQAPQMPPSSKKRANSESPDGASEPSSKKTKQDGPSRAPVVIDKTNWQGYCEIESDPAYFSVILREIGVEGVNVQEVHSLGFDALMSLPPIYGLVLLFRYRAVDQHRQNEICPEHVWFANQMPGQNSCATLAMIHTLLNVDDPDIDVGERMRQFKSFTQDMTPPQRGQTFAIWDFVKKIHNSFAKKMDILENDKYIAAKATKAAKRQFAESKKTAVLETASSSKTARRDSDSSQDSDASVKEFEANAHHYISFVPIDGEVWKLDGMDRQPTLMSKYDEDQGELWFGGISDRINSLMGAGDNDYGVYAITQSPIVSVRNKMIEADNTIKHVDVRMTSINTDWKDFLDEDYREPPSPSFMGSFSEEMRAANPVPGSIKAAIDKEDLVGLLDRHRSLVTKMQDLIMEYMEKQQEVEAQNERAQDRRWDYGPAIQKWMSILARKGHIKKNIADFENK